jgi:ABC-type nitrate/sulfonate/bicarbonate transport system permease component
MIAAVTNRVSGEGIRNVYSNSRLLRIVVRLLPLGILLLIWEVASGMLVPESILPSFVATTGEIYALGTSDRLYVHMGSTVFRGFLGVIIATVLAVPIGLAMAESSPVERALDPVVSLTYPVPKSPLIPLMVFWLGSGHLSRIALAVVGAILPILISTHNGASSVQEEFVWVAETMGLSRAQRVRHVVFPGALPTVLTGIRIGLIFSFIIVISSELINVAGGGLGMLIDGAAQFGLYEQVFAMVFWTAVLVAGLDRLYLFLTSYLLRWSEQEVGSV